MARDRRPRNEEVRLARELALATREYRLALFSVPEVPCELIRRWRELRSQGAATRRLAEGHGRRDAAQGEHIDHCLEEAGRLVEGRDRIALQGPEACRPIEERIAAWLVRADLSLALLREVERGIGRRPVALERASQRVSLLRNRIASDHLGLVVSLARGFQHLGLPLGDLVQEGALGLLRAIECYDPERGASLATYAAWWIRHSVVRAVQNHGRTVRIPTHRYQELRALRRAELAFERERGRAASVEELARELALEAEDLEALRLAFRDPLPLDAAGTGDSAPPSPSSHPVRDLSLDGAEAGLVLLHEICTLQRRMARLPPRERAILSLRFGLGGEAPLPLRNVGERLGLSGERVRQLERTALDRLRRLCSTDAG